MMKTISIHHDPGHAWGKVRRAELIELGILDQITPYSYQRGEFVYLEEDFDLKTYLKAIGHECKFRSYLSSGHSVIRKYSPFNPDHPPASGIPGELISFYIGGKTFRLLRKLETGKTWHIELTKNNSDRFVYRASNNRVMNAYHVGGSV